MKERVTGNPWTKQEDELLIRAVQQHGDEDNWKTIAMYVPGRTNKACRKRWLHSLSPNIKKSAWTQDEDLLLLRLHAIHGPKWSAIARDIPGRTDDACSKRYREALDPSLRRDEWTAEEDQKLLKVPADRGVQWGQIGRELNRSGLACRNRWRMLNRKKAQVGPRNDHSLVLDTLFADKPADSNAEAQPPWELPMPFVESNFWNPEGQEYASLEGLAQEEANTQFSSLPPAAYLSPDYAASDMTDITQPTAPFNYSSSSLSAALSLAAVSPSSTQLNSPIVNHTSPAPVVNDTQPPNVGQARVSSLSAAVTSIQEHLIPTTQSYLSPSPTSSSSTDLSALGSQDLSVPVPFDDSPPEDCSPNYDTAVTQSESPSIQVATYPTPGPSPVIDEPMHFVSEQDTSPEAAAPVHYRTTTEKKKVAVSKGATNKKLSRSTVKGGPPRLSASLPASDNVPAYVCGHEACWPPGEPHSHKCYRTSQELYDHWKVEHSDDSACERPYRCGLPECGKGWKSINGLQYHLQLSKAHFQKAISASITTQPDTAVVDITDAGSKKKIFACPRPGCANQYKQMSGLRYHLTHGHNQQLPHQLNYVPPALARKVAGKLHHQTPPPDASPVQVSAQPGQ